MSYYLLELRGKFSPPEPENRISSVIHADRTEHSKKPIEVVEMLDKLYPDKDKVELFSRQTMDGWESWGYESTETNTQKSEV